MKHNRTQPLMRQSHIPLILLGAVMAGYGLLTAVVGSWLSSQAMRGLITAGAYRSRLLTFEQTAGLIAGLLLFLLFVLCAIRASGLVRVAFALGALASAAPLLAGRAERLLFQGLGLPTMGAGSVLAGAVITLLFALPMTLFFILLASGKRVPREGRWLALASIFVVLGTAFFPIYVTVLAFLLRPGDPAVGRMIQLSTQVIKLRFLLPGLSLLALSYISIRFARQAAVGTAAFADADTAGADAAALALAAVEKGESR
jgi:hypothetical protein